VFERFTDSAREVLVLAQEEARLLHSGIIDTEHILLGLVREEGAAGAFLGGSDVSLAAVRDKVVETSTVSAAAEAPPFSPRAKKVLELSLREALQLDHSTIAPEHLLLALIREGEGNGAQILIGLGVDLSLLRQRVTMALMEGDPSTRHLPYPSFVRGRAARAARLVACSFCGLAPPESGQLVSGDNAFICERCIEHWSQYMRSATSAIVRPVVFPPQAPSEVIPTGPPPADIDTAQAEIQAAFAAHGTTSKDGASIPSVERGEDLGPVVAMAKAKARSRGIADEGSDVAVTVDEVQFIDAEHAAAWFSISINGRSMVRHHRGDAVLVDGKWKMARSTFCHIMSMGGVPCPPDKG
jgi:hypothetical protein